MAEAQQVWIAVESAADCRIGGVARKHVGGLVYRRHTISGEEFSLCAIFPDWERFNRTERRRRQQWLNE